MADMKKTWKVMVPPKDRPTKKMNDYNIANIFSTTLRDTGEVALIDGDTKQIINIVKTGYAVHFAHLGIGPLPVRDRPRWPREHDRPVDGQNLTTLLKSALVWKPARWTPPSTKGKEGDFTDKLAIAGAYWPPVRHHEWRHAGAHEDRLDPWHDGGHPGIPP